MFCFAEGSTEIVESLKSVCLGPFFFLHDHQGSFRKDPQSWKDFAEYNSVPSPSHDQRS